MLQFQIDAPSVVENTSLASPFFTCNVVYSAEKLLTLERQKEGGGGGNQFFWPKM